jgi:hypothetical protein
MPLLTFKVQNQHSQCANLALRIKPTPGAAPQDAHAAPAPRRSSEKHRHSARKKRGS